MAMSDGAPRTPRRSARVRAAIGGVLLLGLLGLATAVVGAIVTPGGTTTAVDAGGAAAEGGASPSGPAGAGDDGAGTGGGAAATAVIVHVLGAVRTPGIVEVRPGDRVVDAIAAAGGTTEDADLGGVNLARVLADGEQLRVPRAGEVVTPPPPAEGTATAGGAPADSSVVNLNTADAAALETLPGVGPALAARIIAWRDENGPFRAVDELLAVSGIGDRTLEGFRDQVTV
ncbi:ComEA family DNA-binding protein [Microcella daejeonensis]|uniref:ComEA family DNA-binding protein n=1 Tax=Microcella daejeonensis TaxID=2994971 RepID=A0A9E8MLP9_9MICO|nr:ComEA family DNA-binding protein [Microcella daejeonensis]WAB81046.1 ComEA family DNA-binding protein [Microcella daejeonensis]